MTIIRLIVTAVSLGFLLLLVPNNAASATLPVLQDEQPKILIFSKTAGFRHDSIEEGVKQVKELCAKQNIDAVHTENSDYFQPDSLAQFDVVMFLNTTGDILDDTQQNHFEQFIKEGGGFVGIHSATDTEYEWPWYGKLVGAYFTSHPQVQEATISVVDHDHPTTSFLPEEWVRTDEWYNYRNINPEINVLLNLEESSYEGGENGEHHPIAWYQEYQGGRIFYTGGGHTRSSYSEPMFRRHLSAGIAYVLGEPIK